MILIIDNYDSFTFNLVQLIRALNSDVPLKVIRNDDLSLQEISQLAPGGIVISPGPGRPDDAGISLPVIKEFACCVPILGVCLGHQCIAQTYGADIIPAKTLMHGKTSKIFHNSEGIFTGLTSPFVATRYHSLAVDPNTLPACLTICARTSDGEIMGIRHLQLPLYGVQFHPESFLTHQGSRIMANFIQITSITAPGLQGINPTGAA